jgi:hypothetical protein
LINYEWEGVSANWEMNPLPHFGGGVDGADNSSLLLLLLFTVKLQIIQWLKSSILLTGKFVRVSELSTSYRIKSLKEIENF